MSGHVVSYVSRAKTVSFTHFDQCFHFLERISVSKGVRVSSCSVILLAALIWCGLHETPCVSYISDLHQVPGTF